jgi:hypothetical protein
MQAVHRPEPRPRACSNGPSPRTACLRARRRSSHRGSLGTSVRSPAGLYGRRGRRSDRAGTRDLTYIAGMHRRELPTFGVALALLLLAGCGASGRPSSNSAALAERARASLVATFTDTPWRLPPVARPDCVDARQSKTTRVGSDDAYERTIYCALNRSAMRHLLGRLDRGLGTDVTATQRSCINRKVTRDQIAALLSAQELGGHGRAAAVAEFDDQLASSTRECTHS